MTALPSLPSSETNTLELAALFNALPSGPTVNVKGTGLPRIGAARVIYGGFVAVVPRARAANANPIELPGFLDAFRADVAVHVKLTRQNRCARKKRSHKNRLHPYLLVKSLPHPSPSPKLNISTCEATP